jgi:hypothetical protein
MLNHERTQALNLIVVSPGDVQPEREAMNAIVADLNRIITSQFGLELRVLRWETDVYPAFHLEGPQGQVDEALQIDNCDIMVGIFWKRFGTPVRDAGSGTEHELGRAYTAWKASDGKRPQIMVYFKNKKYECTNRAEKKQMAQVENYKKKLSKDALWWSYKTKLEFERLIRDHLLMYLLKNAGQLGGKSYRVIKSSKDLLAYNARIVNEARENLFTTGSRSRDVSYLKAIEQRLQAMPALVHHRVLFGVPYHQVLKDHLRQLLKLRHPEDRTHGFKTIHLGLFNDYHRQFETFILGNEREALVLLPSLLGVGEYNSGIIFTGRDEVDGLLRFVKDLYGWSTKVETLAEIEALRTLDEPATLRTPEEGVST